MNLTIMPNLSVQNQQCSNFKSIANKSKAQQSISFKSKNETKLVKCLINIAAHDSVNRSLAVDFKSMLGTLKMYGVKIKRLAEKGFSYSLTGNDEDKIGKLSFSRNRKLSSQTVEFESGKSDADTLSLTVIRNKKK